MVKTSMLNLLLLSLLPLAATGFDHSVVAAGDIALVDAETTIPDIVTLFTNEDILVSVSGIEWEEHNFTASEPDDFTDTVLIWESAVDGVVQATGNVSAADLPSDLDCGIVRVTSNGRRKITVTLSIDNSTASTDTELQAFGPGAAIVPLIVVLILALTTQMVEFSLFFAIFVGSCMVTGNIKDGFKALLDDYILYALANDGHAYVYLFTLFLSGMVGMMEKSGGMIGFTRAVAQYATSPRAGQAATFCIGCLVFFDDYANTLLAGETMRPLTDLLFISREKLAFVVDATAAPVASLTPISSWVGFEVGLIQTEIDRLEGIFGVGELTIDTSGLAVFLQSIKYRYYPIFMMILIPTLIFTQRDFGPMLIAERKTQVYMRTDGGDGKGPGSKDEEGGKKKENQPNSDTPCKSWNMGVPILLLVFFIFYLLVKTGEGENDDGSERDFMEKIEASDSYSALLWGTMAAANLTTLMYLVQIVYQGELVVPTWDIIKGLFAKEPEPSENPELKELTGEEEERKGGLGATSKDDAPFPVNPRPLMSLHDTVESFLYGMSRIFPALIVLTLAWASGSVMVAVGADRLFSRWIVGGVDAESLPTLSFIISLFMALATGTSWGTMTILFPLICVPTYQVSEGDPTIFYATVAGILSGSVAGDHVSPISDTTVLSALASDCQLMAHVTTQAPYAVMMSVLAILFGTLPIGRDAWPNIIGILLGCVAIGLIAFGLCVPIKSPTGRWDICTMLYMKIKGPECPLVQLQTDTINSFSEAGNEEEDASPAEAPEEKEGMAQPEKTSDEEQVVDA